MRHRLVSILFVVVALAARLPLSAEADKGNPTARCFPVAEFVPPQPTYIPDVPFTIEFRPVSGDWPTTPTEHGWTVGDGGPFIDGTQIQEFTFGQEYGDFVEVRANAAGPGFPGECTKWSTGFKPVMVRRFDATPSPTATPFPTTPIETPCPVPCRISYPRGFQSDVPLSFHILTTPPTAPRFLAPSSGGPGVPIQFVEPGRWWVEGLQPGTQYVLEVYCGDDCRGNGVSGILPFTTVSETPSPTPTTATPSPTNDRHHIYIDGDSDSAVSNGDLDANHRHVDGDAHGSPFRRPHPRTRRVETDGFCRSFGSRGILPQVNAGNAWNDTNGAPNWPLRRQSVPTGITIPVRPFRMFRHDEEDFDPGTKGVRWRGGRSSVRLAPSMTGPPSNGAANPWPCCFPHILDQHEILDRVYREASV
jgi:hypothetical protein